jgi:hypothetical protein
MTAIRVYESYDVALTHAVAELEPGERLLIHHDACEIEDDGECTCIPVLWAGAGEA